jgi:hypothetical protein
MVGKNIAAPEETAHACIFASASPKLAEDFADFPTLVLRLNTMTQPSTSGLCPIHSRSLTAGMGANVAAFKTHKPQTHIAFSAPLMGTRTALLKAAIAMAYHPQTPLRKLCITAPKCDISMSKNQYNLLAISKIATANPAKITKNKNFNFDCETVTSHLPIQNQQHAATQQAASQSL